MGRLKVEQLVLGPVSTNCYFALNQETKELLIIDPADSPKRIFQKVEDMGAKPVGILLTHGHFDHIMSVDFLRDKYHIPAIAYADEKELLNEREQQLILFNNTKAEMLRDKVRHNFKLADFITQETTKDGKLIETFKLAVNGIEYNALNTGMKILVALDLIDNIQRLKDKRLPILMDGLGELTRLPEVDTQIIGCRAKFQVNKKIELINE